MDFVNQFMSLVISFVQQNLVGLIAGFIIANMMNKGKGNAQGGMQGNQAGGRPMGGPMNNQMGGRPTGGPMNNQMGGRPMGGPMNNQMGVPPQNRPPMGPGNGRF